MFRCLSRIGAVGTRSWGSSMKLSTAHKILIASAVVLFSGYGVWEFLHAADGYGSWQRGVVSFLAALALGGYLVWFWLFRDEEGA